MGDDVEDAKLIRNVVLDSIVLFYTLNNLSSILVVRNNQTVRS